MLNFIKRSIQWKLLLTMISFVVVLVGSLTFVQIRAQTRILEKELERRITLMKQNLSDRGKTLSDNLGRQAENDIASFNLSYVTELIKKVVNEDKELAYAILMAFDRTAYIHTLKPELQQEVLSADEDQFAASQEEATINEFKRNDGSFSEFIVPIRVSTEPWGVLRLGFTLDFLNEEIVKSRTEIAKQTRDMFIRSVMTSIVFIFLSALTVLFISTRLSKPLILLTESARQLAKGNFAAVANIEFRSQDEVGVLADTFAEMSTNLKISYEALRESESLKGGILESALDGIITIDSEGKVIEFNSAAANTFGYTRDEVMGRAIAELIIPPVAREAHRRGLTHYLATGEGPILNKRIELTGMRADGSEFPVELAITPTHLEKNVPVFTAHLRDITERVRAQAALRESEEMYRAIFETTGTAAIMVEDDMTISLANTEFEKLTGNTKEEIEGKKSWTEFVTEGNLERIKAYHRLRRTDPDTAPARFESQLINRSENVRDCLITVSMIPGTKKSATFIVDTTEQRAEAEQLQAAKMESLRQLVAGIAHQMNNPIGAISSNIDISGRAIKQIKAISTEQKCAGEIRGHGQLVKSVAILEQMNRVNQIAASGIAKIVANLRRFIRLDEAEWQIADIHEGIDNVIALMEPEFESRIRIKKDYGDLPRVYCSPSSLNQVFINLLKNAAESIEGEGEIAIKTFARQGEVTIEISDTGRGIPDEHKGRIFDPGYTTKGAKVGMGLGLSICYEIVVNRHQGRIDVFSNDKETKFTITMSATRRQNVTRA